MSETALAKPKDVYAYFDSAMFKQKLIASIPNQMKPERMVQLALAMIKSSPALQRCSGISILASVIQCAQLGLELDRILGHAYLVPFKDECTLIVGYRGFQHLAYQAGTVSDISAEVVRSRDKFQLSLGSDRKLFHVPAPTRTAKELTDSDTWRGA